MTTGIVEVGSAFGRVAVGHPIDVASGEFFTTDIDHELAGIVPLSLGRTFNSKFVSKPALETIGALEPQWLPFGPGWRPTWFAELRATMSGFLYTRPDGVEFSIRDGKADKSLARAGRIFSQGDGLEIQRVDDRQVRVIGYGRNRNEFSLVFEHVSARDYRLVAIERTQEGKISIFYDQNGRPRLLLQRREGRSYELVHEGERVTRVVLHLPDRTKRVIAEYSYDALGRLVSVRDSRGVAAAYAYDERHRIVHDEKRGGSVYTVGYRPDGRCDYASGTNRYQERSLAYEPSGRKTWVKDSHGHVTLYEWNERGQVIKTTSPCGVVTRAEFDDLGRPVRETGPNGELREYVYDDLGRLSVDRAYGGIETTFHYDSDHRLIAYEEAFDGDVVTRGHFTYDPDHNVTSAQLNEQPAWQYEWNAYGELVSMTAPSGATAYREYDGFGGLQRSTNWEGHAWEWTRDALGRVLTETDPLGHCWRVEYLDDDGRSLRVMEPDGRRYEREISPDERTIVQRLPGDRVRSVELSFCGNPLTLRDEEGCVTRLHWGTEPGELLTIANANLAEYAFAYDADLRIVERRTFDGRSLRTEWQGTRIAAAYDGMGRRTAYEYDFRGLVTNQKNDDGETKLAYDKHGLLATVVTPTATTQLWRDDLGRVIAEEQDGVRIERSLDLAGRPVLHKTPFGAETAFAWSRAGNLMSLRYGDIEIAFERDALGREVKRRLGDAGTFEQTYDPVGRLVSQAFRSKPSGLSTDVSHSPGVLRRFGFDERGFLASIEDSLRGHTRLMHDARGDLTGVVRQNGSSDFYLYDRCQNRIYHAATAHGAALAAAVENADRVQAIEGKVRVDRLATRFPHHEQSFGYEAGDRVVTIVRADGEVRLTYDANGQVISKTVRRGNDRTTWQYHWNARGELTSVTTPNGKVWTYRYDGSGRRIEKRSPTGDAWRYLWMGNVLYQALKNGELSETYVHDPRGGCPILRDDGRTNFILPAQNEAPSEEIATDGTLAWAAQKGTWGEAWSRLGVAGGEPFAGQLYDTESGLHYNYFRYYDPEIGRYLSPDPIDLAGGLNAYVYAFDPFTNSDQFGLSIGPKCAATAAKPGHPPSAPDDEVYYRTMSQADADHLRATGQLRPTSETFISPTRAFSEGYGGVLVEFKVRAGTTEQLAQIGVRDNSRNTSRAYPNMPAVRPGWTTESAFFKGEGKQINIGLGRGPALDIFNTNIRGHNVTRS